MFPETFAIKAAIKSKRKDKFGSFPASNTPEKFLIP